MLKIYAFNIFQLIIDIKMVIKKITFCIKCNKYRKFKNIQISWMFDKTLILFLFKVNVVIMKKKRKIYWDINSEWVKCTSDFILFSPNEDGKVSKNK